MMQGLPVWVGGGVGEGVGGGNISLGTSGAIVYPLYIVSAGVGKFDTSQLKPLRNCVIERKHDFDDGFLQTPSI